MALLVVNAAPGEFESGMNGQTHEHMATLALTPTLTPTLARARTVPHIPKPNPSSWP